MQPGESSLDLLARAVADGDGVDWDHAESSAVDADERSVVRQLRELATLVHTSRARTRTWGTLELREEIGRGTFGTVYRAWDSRLEREVALKLLHVPPSALPSLSAVITEGQLLARIRHEHIVTVYGADVFEDRAGIWMEFIVGRTLKAIVEDQGPFGAPEAAVIGRDVCRALAAVHQKGLLHRDIKAQNVMRQAGGRTVLMDFGAAVALHTNPESTPRLRGTPAYLAPEVLAGDSATVQSDLYSVGVLLFYLVTGEFPVVAGSLDELRQRHAAGSRRLLRDLRPDLSTAFVAVVDDVLSPAAGDRCASAGTLQKQLESALTETNVLGPSKRWAAALPWWRTAALIGVAVMAIVIAIATSMLNRPVDGVGVGKSVAILPFKDLTGGSGQDAAFSDGITDDLIAHLSSLRDLRVISGNSVRRFRDNSKTEAEIGAALGVGSVLDGSIRQFDGRVRIVSRLVDARSGEQLWSESFERDLKDVAAMQSEVARKIAVALKVELSEGVGSARSRNFEAFSLYSKGRYHWKNRKDDGQDISESIRYYQQAIAIDPGYALAYAGLADSYMSQGVYNVIPRTVAYERSEQAALKAIELDNSLAEAHAALGYVHKARFRWQPAEASFRRAIELKPSFAEPHQWLSVLLTQQGRLAEAISEIKAAIDLDPLSLAASMQLGSALLMGRRYDAARAQFEQVLRSDPGIAVAYRAIAVTHAQQNRYDAALRELERAAAHMPPGTEDREVKSYTGVVLARAGRTAEAVRIRTELIDRFTLAREPIAGNIAAIEAALGRPNEALDWLEKAVAINDPELNYLKVDPRWDTVRNSPRFIGILNHLGFAQ